MVSDLKYAFRQLFKSPGFSIIAVLTLALGIGANTAIFSLVDASFLKVLAARKPDQLVLLSWTTAQWPPHMGQTGGDARFSFSYPAFEQFRKTNSALADTFAFVPLGFIPQNATVTVKGEPSTANALMVTGGYFSGLGVRPLLGRAINEQDEVSGAPRVGVIGYSYWTRHFNRDPGIIGRTMTINDISFTVVGVAPAEFHGIYPWAALDPDIWMAFADLPNLRPWGVRPMHGESVFTEKNWACLNIAGRLNPSVTQAQAEASLDVVFRNLLTSDWKPRSPGQVPHLRLIAAGRGLAGMGDEVSSMLMILTSAVGLLLLIACANLATLLLARANGRQREMSIRLAVGASRWRVVRQLLTESILLSAIGGAVGLLIADAGIGLLVGLISAGRGPLAFDAGIDATTFFFTAGVSIATGVFFGIAPAFRVAQLDLSSAMKQSAGNASGGRKGHRLGTALVVVQISASVALMIAAGLFVRTLQEMNKRDLGFNQQNLLVFGLDPTRGGYRGDRLLNLYDQLRREIQALPSVRTVTLLGNLPFNGSNNSDFGIVGSSRKIDNKIVRWDAVGPDVCTTLQIPLLMGRDILERDGASAPKVGLVNEMFVHRFLGDENPIGQHFYGPTGGPSGPTPYEIIGVFKDVELMDLHAKPKPKAFIPYAQAGSVETMYFEVRSQGDPALLASAMREAVRRVDPHLPLLNLATQTQLAEDALVRERMLALLASFFGATALLLACIGLYGTMAYSVARRTREIGVRIALGASPRSVLRMVLGQGLKVALLGIAIGFATSLGITRAIQGVLYGVTADDPATYAFAALVMAGVAILSCYLPARRATRVDPILALRSE